LAGPRLAGAQTLPMREDNPVHQLPPATLNMLSPDLLKELKKPAPPPMTLDQKQDIAKSAFRLPQLPTLGKAVQLSPSAPLVKGLAWLQLGNAHVVSANEATNLATLFWDLTANDYASIVIGWVSDGSNYLVDCSLLSGLPLSFQFRVTNGKSQPIQTGQVGFS